MKPITYKQHDEKDCGPACLATVFSHYGCTLPLTKVREAARTDQNGTSLFGLARACYEFGFDSESFLNEEKELDELKHFPMIAHTIKDKKLAHYVVIYKISASAVHVFDPGEGRKKIPVSDFIGEWTGVILTVEPNTDFKSCNLHEGLFGRFWKLLFPHKALMVKIFLASLIYTFLGIGLTYYLRYVIDNVLVNKSLSLLATITIAAGATYVVKAGIELIRSRLLLNLSQSVNKGMIARYYKHVIQLPQSFYDNRKAGEILSRLNDSGKIVNAVSSVSLALMIDTLMMIGAAYILLNQHLLMFLVVLAIIPLDFIVSWFFSGKYKKNNRKQMQCSAELNSHLFETMRIPLQIKSNNIEQQVSDKTNDKLMSFLQYWFKSNLIKNIQYSSFDMIKSLGSTAVIFIGSMDIINGNFTIGRLMSYTALMGFFLNPVQRLIRLLPVLQEASIASDRLGEILDMEPEKNEAAVESISEIDRIDVNDLTFGYGYREPVLHNVTLSIKRGERVGIVGESGSGKSTLAKLVLKFYETENDKILINGNDIGTYDFASLRNSIGYVPQDAGLLSGSIKENILFGLSDVSEEDLAMCSKAASVDAFVKKMPMGYDTLVGEYGVNLSGGQKQRIAIARGLLRKPHVLIMDEATCNLDSEAEMNIYNNIMKKTDIETQIIITHRLYTVADCDKIYVLKEGEIVGCGTHAELVDSCKEYKRLWRNQTAGQQVLV